MSEQLIDFVNLNFTCDSSMQACFTAFDKNCDGNLNLDEFRTLCAALFRNDSGESYELEENQLAEIFSIFDTNTDGLIDIEEFTFCWNRWIKTIVHPVTALIVVDVQNDFISGTLNISNCPAKHNGEDVISPINNLLDSVDFDAVYYSYDWHPSDHVSFIDNIHLRKFDGSSSVPAEKAKVYDTVVFEGEPPMVQKLWPRHCVQNTVGSELHPELKVLNNSMKVYKGTNPEVDSYSVFCDNSKMTDTKLHSLLKMKNITDVYLCGLAYDVCVGSTAMDALTRGYRTVLIDDCSRGVDLLDIEKTKNYIKENHGLVVNSPEVLSLVKGYDRRPALGYKLAIELQKTRDS